MANSAQLRNEIAAGKWDDKLRALYGDAAQEICRQRARYCAALEQFELYFGPGRQVQVYSAPGRAELGGNHTDHQHGYGLAAAVTLDLVAVAAHNTDGYVRVKSRGFNKLDVIDLTVEGPQEGESTHSASLIRGIAEGFRAQAKRWAALMHTRPVMCCAAAAFPALLPLKWAWLPSGTENMAAVWPRRSWQRSVSMRRIPILASPAACWIS